MQSDILFAPACLAGVSAILLVARSISLTLSKRSSTSNGDIKNGILKAGKAVFAWRLLRLMGCLVLLGLSVASTVLQPRAPRDLYAHIAICVTFVSCPYFFSKLSAYALQAYAVLLGALSTFGSGARKPTSDHLTILLLVTMGVYAYRDLYPLAIIGKQPMDASAGRFLWPTVSILAFTSVGTLLLTPSEYVPVDPEVCVLLLVQTPCLS